MASYDNVFGPRVDPSHRAFDFTLLFEDAILACLPTAAFLLILPLLFCFLFKKPNVVKRSNLLTAKVLTLFSLLVCQVVFLALRSVNSARNLKTQASLAADVLGIAGTIGAGLLSWLDHRRSIRPSSLLAVYILIAAVLDAARVRTLWSIQGAMGPASVLSLMLGLKLLALVLESTSKGQSSLRSPHEYSGVGSEPFSGLWTRIGYVWLLGTVRQGYNSILSVDDLPEIEPQLRSGVLHSELEKEWVNGGCFYSPLFQLTFILTYN